MTTVRPRSEVSVGAVYVEGACYHKTLRPRQLRIIALGGAIGTGLFLGTAGRLHSAGLGLLLVYGVCGVFVSSILRVLGELVLHRPSSGSSVSCARELYGEGPSLVTGHGGLFPAGLSALVTVTTAVVSACAGVELVGVAAGDAQTPEKDGSAPSVASRMEE